MPVRLLQVTALAAFFCASGAHAAPLQIPTNVPIIEVLQQTNTYNYTPVNEANSTVKRVVPISDALVTGQNVSDVEPKVSSTRRLPIGKGADVTASVKIPKANIARALILSAKLGGKIAGGVVGGLILEELLNYGLKNVRIDGEKLVADAPDPGAIISNGRKYWWPGAENPWYYSLSDICASKEYKPNANGNGCDGKYGYVSVIVGNNVSCPAGWYIKDSSCTKDVPLSTLSEQQLYDYMVSNSGVGWPSSSAVALQSMLQYPDTRKILQDFPNNGVDILGPSSVPGKSTTTTDSVQLVPGTNTVAAPGTPSSQTQPGTQTTTTTATHPITYSGNSVSHSTVNNTTTNITNNATNVTTSQTKTEEVKDDKEPDQCQKYPDTIGCKEIDFDTPEGQIPRKQIDVSWSPVDLGLGGGSCPAPVQIYENKQFSYQSTCDNLHIIKPLVIAIALFVGGMILFGGRADQ